MEIPTNNVVDTKKQEVINKIISDFNKGDNTYYSYKASNGVTLGLAKEICREFVKKGYHAKINYFCDGRASYQCFAISKKHLDESQGRMIYTDIIG